MPDWAGNLYAVNRATGAVVWQRTIASYTGITGDKARATPAVTDSAIVIGTQGPFGGGGKVLAINKDTGDLLWRTQADSNLGAIITQSATVFDGVVYVGVASQEEAYAAVVPNYVCCTFRGSMLALDLATGKILWTTYLTPAGSPGVAVWGSSPAIDTKRGSVYIATGNNYNMPPEVLACVQAAGSDPVAQTACLPRDDHFDSIVALDMKTGAIKWATRALPFDAGPSRASSATRPTVQSRPAGLRLRPGAWTLHRQGRREAARPRGGGSEEWSVLGTRRRHRCGRLEDPGRPRGCRGWTPVGLGR